MTTYEEYDDDLADWPTAPKTIEALRAIYEDRSAKVIDGVMVDMQSAQAIVVVYDALNEANKVKFAAMPIEKMGAIAWSLVK